MRSIALASGLALTILATSAHAHAEPRRATRTKSPALIAGGTGAIVFGLAAGAGGAFFTAFALNCSQCINPPQAGLFAIAGAFDLLAIGGIASGIAMISIGARKVDVPGSVVGGECAVTSECGGGQHCIEGRCRSLEATEASEEHARPSSVSGAIMLGDGRGYVPAAVITDLCAFLTTVPPWMIAYAADASRFGTGFQILPFIQLAAGPALHLFEGRVGPALISALGWTTVAMTTFFVPTVVSPYGDRPNGLAAGTAMLVGGGIAMTVVDAFMARPARSTETTTQTTWAPSLRFVPGGAIGGLGGTF